MSEHRDFWEAMADIQQLPDAYEADAYVFLMHALEHTMRAIGERRHVGGGELLLHACQFAKQEYGMLAYDVLKSWGVETGEDLGYVVFHLVAAGVLSQQENDSIDDFSGVLDLRNELEDRYFDAGT